MNRLIKKLLLLVIVVLTSFNILYAQVEEYPFKIEQSGNGKQAIIFLPGFASSGDVWNETRDRYENDFNCYTLTMAGFAGVEPQVNASFDHWENEIVRFIKETHINKPILIGHSMGGVMALAIASDFQDLISKIVVVDALPCLSAIMNPQFESVNNIDCTETINQMLQMTDEQFLQMQKITISQMTSDTTKQKNIIEWSLKSDRKTLAKMFCDFSNHDLRTKIKSIKCPSLILLESYFVSIKSTIQEQYKNLKTSNLQYANKGLHFIMYDDPEWYFHQIDNFILVK